jgi:single-strand DNA-binding protein
MATTVTFKLNKEATQFQAGDSQGFGIRGGVQYYDRETKQKEWTNYEAAIFAKAGPQADFYAQSLVAGSIVEVTGQQIKVRKFDGQNGQVITLELIDAKLGMVHTGNAPQQQAQQAHRPQQQQPQQQAQRPQQNQQQQQQQYQPQQGQPQHQEQQQGGYSAGK